MNEEIRYQQIQDYLEGRLDEAAETASQYDNDAIAGTYYDNDLLQRVRGNNSASLLQEGMDLYENGNYEQAIEYLGGVTDPALEAEAAYAATHAHYNLE